MVSTKLKKIYISFSLIPFKIMERRAAPPSLQNFGESFLFHFFWQNEHFLHSFPLSPESYFPQVPREAAKKIFNGSAIKALTSPPEINGSRNFAVGKKG